MLRNIVDKDTLELIINETTELTVNPLLLSINKSIPIEVTANDIFTDYPSQKKVTICKSKTGSYVRKMFGQSINYKEIILTQLIQPDSFQQEMQLFTKLKFPIECSYLKNYRYNNLFTSIIRKLKQLHQQGVVHGDPYMRNYVFDPETGDLDLIDYGYSVLIGYEEKSFLKANLYDMVDFVKPIFFHADSRLVDIYAVCMELDERVDAKKWIIRELLSGKRKFEIVENLEKYVSRTDALILTNYSACNEKELIKIVNQIYHYELDLEEKATKIMNLFDMLKYNDDDLNKVMNMDNDRDPELFAKIFEQILIRSAKILEIFETM